MADGMHGMTARRHPLRRLIYMLEKGLRWPQRGFSTDQ